MRHSRRLIAQWTVIALLVFVPIVEAGSVTIAWDPNPETDISGYLIQYGTNPGGYTDSVSVSKTTTQWTLTNLSEGARYYITVRAVNMAGMVSAPAPEVNGVIAYAAADDTSADAARILFGLGRGGGGWGAVVADSLVGYGMHGWTRLPWDSYNVANGEMHVALGDVDGDGLDEVVIGLAVGGAGWIAVQDDEAHGYALLKWLRVDWDMYNSANGAVYPAVGDIDGDGRAEIVAGLGTGGAGWYQTFDDASTGFRSLGWGRLPWDSYNMSSGELHPALGDFDGNGKADLALGGGVGAGGWVAIANWSGTAWVHQRWLQVSWSAYNSANGTVWPAAGDLDANGRDELVLGLGKGGLGKLEIRKDSVAGFASSQWIQTDWTAYNNANGETHPAVGNVDGDARPELIIGLGPFSAQGGWYQIVDDSSHAYSSIGWRRVPWDNYTLTGGPLFPAIGRLR